MTRTGALKGIRGERELVGVLAHFWEKVRRGRQQRGPGRLGSSGSPDVEGTPIWIECKRNKRAVQWTGAYKIATELRDEARDHRPVAVMARVDGGKWMVHMAVEDFLNMLEADD